jgi:hypothetical protein
VDNASLGTPGAEPFYLQVMEDGDGEILMPGNLPVCFGGLVEQDRADGEGFRTNERLYEAAQPVAVSERLDLRNVQEVAPPTVVRLSVGG